MIKDSKVNKLIEDSYDENGKLPYQVLPIDETRQNIRNGFRFLLINTILFYVAADLDIIDYDITPYNSLKEREEIYKSNKPKKGYLKSYVKKLEELFNNIK